MNIEQIKKDLDNDVIVSRSTIVKLANAALLMEDHLLQGDRGSSTEGQAADILKKIEAM